MQKYSFRSSTLAEREEFYSQEFSISKIKKFFRKNKIPYPQLCAVDAGSETGVILDKEHKGKMFYFKFSELNKKIKHYLPEDVYYDRNRYKDPDKILKTLNFRERISEELVFDLDIDNLSKGKNNLNEKNLKFLFSQAVKMKKELYKIGFKKILIIYSGRGFHVHILDKNACLLNSMERDKLNKRFSRYPIDPWVSRGFIHLIRMPYTLNSLVSRIVIPVKNDRINFNESIPRFLVKDSS
ncbi:MAG: DNA primase small subunit domain-containing protein [Candidatus Pacearchaeota archaeon]